MLDVEHYKKEITHMYYSRLCILSVRHLQVSMEANLTAIVLLHHDDGLGDRRKYFDHDNIRHKQAL